MKRIANEYGLSRPDDLFASVGYGKTLPRNVCENFSGRKNSMNSIRKRKETRLKDRDESRP